MIKLQNLTPEVYYKQSRDFQFIGRLYDLVLNSVKTNTDMIYDIPSSDSAGSKMIDLLALTLGFRARHNYNVKQLSAICSIFPIILKNKGNITAIELICDAILHAEGITEESKVLFDPENPYILQIFISKQLSDITLLNDLLDYVLPAGISCEIIRADHYTFKPATTTITEKSDMVKTVVKYEPAATIVNVDNEQLANTDKDIEHVNGLDGDGNRISGFTINSVIFGKPDTNNSNNGGNE